MIAATLDTPAGPFSVVVHEGEVVRSGWTDPPRAVNRVARIGRVTDAVEAYLDGDLEAIDAVGVTQRSGTFREAVWRALRATPPGAPVTYSELARRCGRPGAARAAGAACAANAAALFVPCHRAVRGDGGLGGFLYGLAVKRWLQAHEARIPPAETG